MSDEQRIDVSRVMRMARRTPLATCVKKKLGHVVGIPPLLRDYRDPIFDLVPDDCRVAVEIGTLQGWFAWRCAEYLPEGARLWCVDPFVDDMVEGYDGEYNRRCWEMNLGAHAGDRVELLAGRSFDVAQAWDNRKKVDFLFVDGDHTYSGVRLDLHMWCAKVRPGGLVAGHDIDGPHGGNVRRALDEYCADHRIEEYDVGPLYSFTGKQVTRCWWFYKPEDGAR